MNGLDEQNWVIKGVLFVLVLVIVYILIKTLFKKFIDPDPVPLPPVIIDEIETRDGSTQMTISEPECEQIAHTLQQSADGTFFNGTDEGTMFRVLQNLNGTDLKCVWNKYAQRSTAGCNDCTLGGMFNVELERSNLGSWDGLFGTKWNCCDGNDGNVGTPCTSRGAFTYYSGKPDESKSMRCLWYKSGIDW